MNNIPVNRDNDFQFKLKQFAQRIKDQLRFVIKSFSSWLAV